MSEAAAQGDANAASPDPSSEKVELLVRRILDDEAGKFRADAIGTLKLLVGAFFGVLVIAGVIGAGLLYYVFGETLESSAVDALIASQVDGVLELEVDARADESVGSAVLRIEEATETAVQSGLSRIAATSLAAEVDAINEITSNISDRVEDVVNEQLSGPIQEELDRLQGQDVQEIISGVFLDLFAEGAIVAFSRQNCPDGWQRFAAASGRFIVGAGSGDGLTIRSVGEVGGAEEVTLNIAQMPAHNHANDNPNDPDTRGMRFLAEFPGISGPQRTVIPGGSPGASGSVDYTGRTPTQGGNQPHNNMPPYIALHFCEYVGVDAG